MKITSHILDTARGAPAAGVRVALAVRGAAGEWREIATGITDTDGRVADLLAGAGDGDGAGAGASGEYRLTFATADYHRDHGVACFHPRVEVVFTVAGVAADNPDAHYHIPLLLSPFGYTTYRGS